MLQNLPVIRRNAFLLHNVRHHFRGALCIDLASVRSAVLTDHAHSLKIRIKLKPTVDESTVSTFAFKAKDDLGIRVGLIKFESSEFKGLDFHGITNQFALGIDPYNGVIGGHIGEDGV
jgi:hypothetical protein